MSEYIFIRKSRNALSSLTHIFLNILLGVGSIAVTFLTASWIPGIILVLISKWRIFAVRPRFWLLNIKSNLVDLIVGSSFVLIAYCSGTELLPVHILLAGLYTLWLIILKPLSTDSATKIQALVAVYLGTTAATLMSASADSIFLTLACFVIGYGTSRHVLVQSSEGKEDFTIVTLICGLISAEIAWLCHGWLIVYMFNGGWVGNTGIIIPQLSIIMTLFAFLFGYTYKAIVNRDGKLKASDILMPAIFSLLIIVIVVIWFSRPIFDV
ncbi:hypothetical protein IKG54_00480 [Candidatus Saccharibacteria bacterium]|nr:hypothetical protein [Candidatus Saccharibacteria bacterium]